jgi:integrase
MPRDSYLVRINRGLRALGVPVTIETVAGGQRLRLRATMPTRTGDWSRQRVTTRLVYPQDIEKAQQLAEALAVDLRRARAGEPFPFDRWTGDRHALPGETVTGLEALWLTERWWRSRRRQPGGDDTWRVDYLQPLQRLQPVAAVTPETLRAVVRLTAAGTRTRLRTAAAAAAVAVALAMPAQLVEELRAMGRGYSGRDAAPRELPADAVIETVIDDLPSDWQWPAGVVATFGARPHEALLSAELQPSGLLTIGGGKTGARQSLPLPKAWVERWELRRKRLPRVDLSRSHREIGGALGQVLRRREAPFRAYDLRHAWAVRAILTPAISPSLAAKSMGHSLAVHSSTYQRWFDAQSMVAVLEGL